jgi:hypothetical protein
MTSAVRLEELQAAARRHRERVSTSIAPRLRPTTAGRLRELERAYADQRSRQAALPAGVTKIYSTGVCRARRSC